MDDEELTRAAFDALPSQTAVLAADGTVVRTNDAWQAFGLANGLPMPADSVGDNYLVVCDGADDEDAAAVAEGLRSVIDAETDQFTYEYPCHEPGGESRWFRLQALRFGDGYLLVVHVDITERKLAELAVEKQNDELELLSRIMAHDVRNPLNVAIARAEFLDEAVESEHLQPLQSSLDRIEAIIDDALLLATDERSPRIGAVDTAVAARAAWEHVDTGDATLVTDDLSVVRADEPLLTQLFENLFANAVEHGGENVTVRVERLENGFAVTDDGTGIPPDDLDTVFEIGYTTGTNGTGFGLAIVERIAEIHGWTVAAVHHPDGVADEGTESAARRRDSPAGARFEITGV